MQETFSNKIQMGAAIGAYHALAISLLTELADGTPRTINLVEIEERLIHEIKQTYSEGGEDYETEIEYVETGIRVIRSFFANIEFSRKQD